MAKFLLPLEQTKFPLKMRSLALATLCCAVLTSCSRYQYVTLDGDLKKNARKEFVHENDTVEVNYRFTGEAGTMEINVHNKVATPLYIDWKKSALIVDGKSFPYWKDESIIRTTSENFDFQWTDRLSTGTSYTEGTLVRNEQISFIPPRSAVTVLPMKVKGEFFKLSPTGGVKSSIHTSAGVQRIVTHAFSDSTTPLKFRSYLTMSLREDFADPITLDNEFWVSEVIESSLEPVYFIPRPDNQFFVRESTGFGTFAAVLFGSAILVGYTVLQQSE